MESVCTCLLVCACAEAGGQPEVSSLEMPSTSFQTGSVAGPEHSQMFWVSDGQVHPVERNAHLNQSQ